ncbi:hypothetical protein K435DRAFT_925078 [Dendrothele bispora CBS 962.96]|uniref:Uncharacterized protein n=1 Tax=Dendrothele bispora (strain CBS 962.96) TaxID=1314807 RepID=A0A4S8MWU9_DENBC|nr:hypothetical protein K435DRAFT_925078 [Dendrothele bispora CBS 962.96]
MPRGTIHGRSVGNASRGGVHAIGGASRGRGPFTAQIPTPPTSDSLITETRNQQRVRQQEELQDKPQDSTRTVGKRKRSYFSIANALSKHKLSDRGRGHGSAPRSHVSGLSGRTRGELFFNAGYFEGVGGGRRDKRVAATMLSHVSAHARDYSAVKPSHLHHCQLKSLRYLLLWSRSYATARPSATSTSSSTARSLWLTYILAPICVSVPSPLPVH